MKKIIIMGAGAFGSEAVWVLEEMNKSKGKSNQWEILGYVDDNTSYKNKFFYDYKNLGPPEKVAIQYSKYELWYFCAIGNNKVREEIVQRFDKFEWKAATLIHPSVIIARNVSIGIGSYIGAGSILCPNVTIGKHVIINVRAAIGHDSILDNFSQINPGAQINGGCRIGRC
jgi:sugar O-acyltransferase (sialic acid O-acetyltransferase NeuD family)